MNILVLNGSPRKQGNTKKMTDSFREGAEAAGHQVDGEAKEMNKFNPMILISRY